MARTRAQGPADENDHTEAPATKRQKLSATKKESAKQKGTPQDAPEALPKERQQSEKEEEASEYAEAPKSGNNSELQHLLSKCGALPLADCNIDVTTSKPDVLLALVFNAMLSSARISHELAYKSVKRLIEAGYHDVATLKKSSWQERTEVLTEGGYTRYREKTATALGELADLVTVKYGCDLNNLLKAAESKPAKIRKSLEEIKQFGKATWTFSVTRRKRPGPVSHPSLIREA